MCGIAGFIRLDGKPVDQGVLDALTDGVSHRGPDGRGTYIDKNVGLGHRRLRIIDLTEAAAQPMLSKDKQTVITFNGEIYNFQDLRKELAAKGRKFTSTGDTEVLLQLYEEEGPACVKKLRGMFVFAIHDKKRNTVFIARDRVGKKPLKYFHQGGLFAFASELKALRTLKECPKEIDHEALHHFLTLMYLPAPMTGIKGIHKLPAAHTMTIDCATGKQTVERYWSLSYQPDEGPSKEEWQEKIRAAFDESVRLRMVADVPVGAFLSGGVDSGAVVAAMSRHSDKPIQTFSIGSKSSVYNELPDAEIVAKRYGTDHHPIMVEPDIVSLLPTLVATYEEPYADPSSIPTYLVARETRNFVTVALNGDGGDENFAGYIRYPILQFSETWAGMPGSVHALARNALKTFHRLRKNTFSYRALRFQESIVLPWEQRYLQYISFFTEEEKRELYASDMSFRRTDRWYADHTRYARERAGTIIDKAVSMDVDTYLADDLLPKVDLGSMAHGLEARSPLLDHKLLELTARIPLRHKLHGRTGKWIFKDMLRKDLPSDTLWQKKRGFRLPLDDWFRGDAKSFVESRLLDSPPAFKEMFDRKALERFLHAYHSSNVNYSDHIWALLWLSEWMEQYNG